MGNEEISIRSPIVTATDVRSDDHADLPFVCPNCGERFGYGPKVVLLTIVGSSPVDENMPCCGVRVKGQVSLNDAGFMQIDEMEVVQ